ncbi:DTW domain-containing protein 1 isoform X2 [Sus scrofa]|uniref:tRNA-uridine aminocarboxypropyltransferase 1 n=1 Tax=Sus scrofa TaxID=9823 RepID=A0A480PKG1_PIG|nr:DTW domain-containing protein 1 isoform X2 [Sus scrofa]XP_020929422.1 DTW domain-containing protein 1 isoform X2 [Sus scrofa]
MSLNTHIFLKEREEENSKFVEIQQSQTTSIAAEDPLQNLCLASQEVLQKAQQNGRSKCLKCGGSRMFYCYTCYVPVENVPTEQIPHVKVALVFPGPRSVSVKDISFHLQKRIENGVRSRNDDLDKPSIKRKKTEEQDLNDNKCKETPLKKIVFIDSTWNQTNKIFSDERLQGLLQVELKTRKTCFWRHQKGKPDTFLSTIEAIYYFLVDYHTDVLKEKYKGQYDNLLFFYSFMHQLIKNAKSPGDKETRKITH